jgi:hypothetical protein
MSVLLARVVLWLLLAIGLLPPVLISIQAMTANRLIRHSPAILRYGSHAHIHDSWATAGIGPLRITITPRIWPAALVLIGAALTVAGLGTLLQRPLAS